MPCLSWLFRLSSRFKSRRKHHVANWSWPVVRNLHVIWNEISAQNQHRLKSFLFLSVCDQLNQHFIYRHLVNSLTRFHLILQTYSRKDWEFQNATSDVSSVCLLCWAKIQHQNTYNILSKLSSVTGNHNQSTTSLSVS